MMEQKYRQLCQNIWNRSWANMSNRQFRQYVRQETEKVFGKHPDKPEVNNVQCTVD